MVPHQFTNAAKRSFLAILLIGLSFSGAYAASGFSSAQEHRPDSVVLTIPEIEDPCGKAWDRLPERFRNKSFGIGGSVTLQPEILFKYSCEKFRSYLSGEVNKLVEQARAAIDVKAAVRQRLDQASQELKASFLSWVAERVREVIVPRLSAEEREKFKTDSEFMREKAAEFLDGRREIEAYVSLYIKENALNLYKAHAAYVDLTTGQSAAILKDLDGLLDKARERIGQLDRLVEEADKAPETPTADLLAKVGMKGEWIDNIKEREGQLRGLNESFKITTIISTIDKASSSNLPHEKVQAMFEFLDTVSGLAADSKIPMASLMGEIVQNLVRAGKELLDRTLELGKRIHARAGFCLGTGVATSDPLSEEMDKKGLTVCPLAIERMPWKDIYYVSDSTDNGPNTDQLYFRVTEKTRRLFGLLGDATVADKLVEGRMNGGGQKAVQEIIKLIGYANSGLGYKIDGGIETLADIYNVDHDGGFLGLADRADEVLRGIAEKADSLVRFRAASFQCGAEKIDAYATRRFGTDFSAFLNEKETSSTNEDREGLGRLKALYSASFLASQGRLGNGNSSRTSAFGTYDRLWEKIKQARFQIVVGYVRDEKHPDGACAKCAGAEVHVGVGGGSEVPGCEIDSANQYGNFTAYIVTESPEPSLSLKAEIDGNSSPEHEFSVDDWPRTVTLLIPFSESASGGGSTGKPPEGNEVCNQAKTLVSVAKAVSLNGRIEKARELFRAAREILAENAAGCPELADQIDNEMNAISAGEAGQGEGKEGGEPKEHIALPDVVGLPFDEAAARIKAAGLTVLSPLPGNPATVQAQIDTVERAVPEHAGPLKRNDGVTLYLYKAVAGPIVPDVVGNSLPDAVGRIKEAGLTPSPQVGKDTKDRAMDGVVYQQQPEAGANASEGQTVTLLTYSFVADLVEVPNVVGKQPDLASQLMRQAGLEPVFKVGDKISDPKMDGAAYHHDPAAGDRVLAGTPVVILVYAYEPAEDREVPDLKGMQPADAEKLLSSAGLKIASVIDKAPLRKAHYGRIHTQSPAAGQMVKAGQVVRVGVYGLSTLAKADFEAMCRAKYKSQFARVDARSDHYVCHYCNPGAVPRNGECMREIAIHEDACRQQYGSQFLRVERQGQGYACRYCNPGFVPRNGDCVSEVAINEDACRQRYGSQFLRLERKGQGYACRYCNPGFVPRNGDCVSEVAINEDACRQRYGSQFLRVERQGQGYSCRYCNPGFVPRGGNCVQVGGPAVPTGPTRVETCNSSVKQGSDTPETVFVQLGNRAGNASFSYRMYGIKDRMLIYIGNSLVLDTGCVSGQKTQSFYVPGGTARVVVQPNCEGTTSTKWDFEFQCPR